MISLRQLLLLSILLVCVSFFTACKRYSEILYERGCDYYEGIGVPVNKKLAVKYWKTAAEHGYAPAQTGLGVCYFMGEGVDVDYEEAVKWFRKAAEQGDSLAQIKVAICYDKGVGTKVDKKEAEKWYRKAAEQGEEFAINALKKFE